MDETKFEKYAILQTRIKEMSKEADELKKDLIEGIKETGQKTIKKDYGKFTLAVKKNWKYSPAVDAKKEEIKILQVEEQERGVAELKETEYLTFKK